jgi:pilus assembly protein FimV
MFERRGFRGLSFAVCVIASGFALGACTKSHDIELSEQPLRAGSSAAGSGVTSGSGGAGVGAAGRMGNAGGMAAAGRTGAAGRIGAAGRTGAAGRAGAAGGGTALGCGTCAAANLFGIIMAPACCTTDNKCGLDLTSLGSAMCVEQNAPGTLDPSCPSGAVMGVMLQGCCRANGECGTQDTYLGLGCTVSTSGTTTTCTPK